jgi:uncharacterized membrane protein HdeD (DUF308 family)
MSLDTQDDSADLLRAELESLRKNWFWLLALGILLIIVGLVAMSSTFLATLATVVMMGTLLLIGGGVEVVNAFWARCWRGFWMHLLTGILYVVLGFLLVQRPRASAAAFTLMLAACFLVGGLFRILIALSQRFHGRWWVLVNGIVTLVLGILIWQEWPESALWVIGLFVGIDMLFAGWSWVMLALAVRGMPEKPV